jgi:tight adherence protein B
MIAGLAASDQLIWLALLSAVGVFTLAVGLYVVVTPSASERRLAGFVGTVGGQARPAVFDSRGRPLDFLRALDRQLQRRQQAASTRMLLTRANAPWSVAELIALRVVVGVVLGVAVIFELLRTFGLPVLVLGLIVGIIASYLPVFYLQISAARRLSALERQLPDAIDLIAASLQAGAAMTQAFTLIARDMPAPISEEFRRMLREMELGLSVSEALTNLVERFPSDDLDLVVTTINVQLRVGGNLVQILRTMNATIRDRVRIRGEIQVLTAQQRLSAIIVGLIPPGLAVVLYLMNPAYIGRLFVPGIGEVLLVACVIMTVVGFLLLRRITNIDI